MSDHSGIAGWVKFQSGSIVNVPFSLPNDGWRRGFKPSEPTFRQPEGRFLPLLFILFRSSFVWAGCPKLIGYQIRMLIIQRLKDFDKDFAHYSSGRSSVLFKLLARHFVHHSSNGIVYLPSDAVKRAYNLLCSASIHRHDSECASSLCLGLEIRFHRLIEIVNAARAV